MDEILKDLQEIVKKTEEQYNYYKAKSADADVMRAEAVKNLEDSRKKTAEAGRLLASNEALAKKYENCENILKREEALLLNETELERIKKNNQEILKEEQEKNKKEAERVAYEFKRLEIQREEIKSSLIKFEKDKENIREEIKKEIFSQIK